MMQKEINVAILSGMASALNSRGTVSLFEIGDALNKRMFDEYLSLLDRNIEEAEPFSMVIDGSSPGLALDCTPDRRWQLMRAQPLGQLHRGIAFVTGTMTRERMQALYAMQVPGVPYAFLPTREEALTWAQTAVRGEEKKALSRRKTVPFMAAVH